ATAGKVRPTMTSVTALGNLHARVSHSPPFRRGPVRMIEQPIIKRRTTPKHLARPARCQRWLFQNLADAVADSRRDVGHGDRRSRWNGGASIRRGLDYRLVVVLDRCICLICEAQPDHPGYRSQPNCRDWASHELLHARSPRLHLDFQVIIERAGKAT